MATFWESLTLLFLCNLLICNDFTLFPVFVLRRNLCSDCPSVLAIVYLLPLLVFLAGTCTVSRRFPLLGWKCMIFISLEVQSRFLDAI